MALFRTSDAGNTIAWHDDSSTRSRSSAYELGPVLIVGGALLAFVGLTDLALFYVTPDFGDASWELATISQTFEAMPLPLLGLVLLALGARAVRSVTGLRALSITFVFWVILTTVLLLLFLLDIPVILHWFRAQSTGSADIAAVRPWPDFGKPFVFAVTYIVSGVILTRVTRQAARQIALE